MFVTHSHLEQEVPAGIATPFTKYWRGVSLSLETPWYLCALERSDGRTETFLVAWEAELLEFLAAAGVSFCVGSIARIERPRAESGRWELRWIDALWSPTPTEQLEGWQVVMRFEGDSKLFDEHLTPVGSSDSRRLVFTASPLN